MEIVKQLKTNMSPKPQDENKLGFGKIFTDHMFLMDYNESEGWHNARIAPFDSISMPLTNMTLHYGQEVFEGLKAYHAADGGINLFRAIDNFKRMNKSNERLCIPKINEEDAVNALIELITVDKDWLPKSEGTSIYIRPTIIAMDSFLGVSASKTYLFFIVLSPSGAYYPEGLKPVKIYVEDEYVRAVKGGIGFAKTAGNYAASILAGEKAKQRGYTQVLWLDGAERKYVEEVGSMNIFFKIGGEIITPALEGSVLPGITRDSVIKLALDRGYKVAERRISIKEVYEAYKDDTLEEVFGSGTAAVISAVGELNWDGNIMEINHGKMGEFSKEMYETLTGIQYGRIRDGYNWITKLNV